jgi:predicted HNH restriction endonuclease
MRTKEESREAMADWRAANPERARATGRRHYEAHKEEQRGKGKRDYAKAKAAVIALYGGICRCCGETNPVFLTIDHINSGGKADPMAARGNFYGKLVKLGKPRKDLRLMCANCNLAVAYGRVCPHQTGSDR